MNRQLNISTVDQLIYFISKKVAGRLCTQRHRDDDESEARENCDLNIKFTFSA